MSDAALALAFFDPAHGLYGMARRGLTLLFDNGRATAEAGPEVDVRGDGLRAVLADRYELEFSPLVEPVQLAGSSVRVCGVVGRVGDRRVDCLGTAAETARPPAWEELDALRAVSAVFDAERALMAVIRRPRGAPGHGRELASAALLTDDGLTAVEDARLSTVYDGGGRQRSASLELWMPGEDFPRRLAGEAVAGTTLDLDGLRVHASIFSWRMGGHEGAGAYELSLRSGPADAA